MQSSGIAACATQIQLDGGAGFLLKDNKNVEVALSVYLKEENAILVKKRLSKNYNSLKVKKISPSPLYFKGGKEKRGAKIVCEAFENFYLIIERLDKIIEELDNSGTQENCKRNLSILSAAFLTYSKTYEEDFKQFSLVCDNAKSDLEEHLAGICYARDLRYLLCAWCIEYVNLSNEFILLKNL